MSGPCCSVGARADAAEIDEALRAVGQPGAESLSGIAARLGLAKSSLHRHKAHLTAQEPGERPAADPVPHEAADDDEAASGPQDAPGEPPGNPRSSPVERDAAAHGTAEERSGTERSRAARPAKPKAALARARAPQPAAEDHPPEVAEHIRKIADIISVGLWKGWPTVCGLSERLGIPPEEVERLHRFAAGKVASARGTLRAQLEASVATTRKLRDDDLDAAIRYDKEATDAYEQAKGKKDRDDAAALYLRAKNARRLAASHRQGALAAQKHHDALTVLKPPPVAIQVNVRATPDYAGAFAVLGRAADALFGPGAAMALDEAVGVWEDGGDEALEAWLSERQVIVADAAE